MLKVPQQQYIRFLREVEGCSIQEIARRVQVNWRTAKKYADMEDWNRPVKRRKGRYPVLGPYLEVIDTWLIEDERLPKKQRHTAKRIYDRLREEFGFEGGRRTVEEYVAKRRNELKLERAKSYERLEHPGGEAQVDFQTCYVAKDGRLAERKVLLMSFPYSNAAFACPMPKENTECFLEGLKRLFEQIGGVPRKIWFDNLPAAVVSIGQDGSRACTDEFLRFAAHYRFEPVFCNPHSGHEKGHVENKVGYSRRNWLTPPPVFSSDEEMASYLTQAAAADMERIHYAKGIRIAELWEQEREKLLVLPETALEVFRLETARVNKYREVRFESVSYPVPQCRPGQMVLLKVKWDEIELLLQVEGAYQHIGCLPRAYTEKTIPIQWREVFAEYVRKPRAVMYSSLAKMLPVCVQSFIRVDDMQRRKQRLRLIHRLLDLYTVEEIADALDDLPVGHAHPEQVLEHVLYATKHPNIRPEPFAEVHTPAELQGFVQDLERYDQILGVRIP